MGRNADNHDVFPVSPTQISHNPDDEGVGLLDDEKQFAGYHDLGPSAHTTKKTWRNIAIISLAAHAFFGLAAMVAFVVYSQSSPRQHPLGELNGLVPECTRAWNVPCSITTYTSQFPSAKWCFKKTRWQHQTTRQPSQPMPPRTTGVPSCRVSFPIVQPLDRGDGG